MSELIKEQSKIEDDLLEFNKNIDILYYQKYKEYIDNKFKKKIKKIERKMQKDGEKVNKKEILEQLLKNKKNKDKEYIEYVIENYDEVMRYYDNQEKLRQIKEDENTLENNIKLKNKNWNNYFNSKILPLKQDDYSKKESYFSKTKEELDKISPNKMTKLTLKNEKDSSKIKQKELENRKHDVEKQLDEIKKEQQQYKKHNINKEQINSLTETNKTSIDFILSLNNNVQEAKQMRLKRKQYANFYLGLQNRILEDFGEMFKKIENNFQKDVIRVAE